jgi:hypothetical protein
MRVPPALYDEFTYLGFARFFSGVAALPAEPNAAYGACGYSLLLAPAFWISRSFTVSYHLALLLNSLFLTASYPLLWWIGRCILGFSPRTAAAAALVASLHPSFLIISSFVATENVFIPVFLAFAIASFRFIESPGFGRAAVFGSLMGFLYLLHSRSLGLVGATLLLHAAMIGLKRARWQHAIVCYLTAAPIVVAAGLLAAKLTHDTGLVETSISHTLNVVLTPDGVTRSFIMFLGQYLNVTVSTAGICVFGMIATADRIRTWKRQSSTEQHISLALCFWVISTIAVSVITASFLASIDPGLVRPDSVASGRYPEGLIAILILVGAGWLMSPKTFRAAACYVGLAAISAAGLAALISIWWTTDWMRGPGPRIGMLAVMGVMRIVGSVEWALPVALTIVLMCLFVIAARFRGSAALLLAGCFYLACATAEFTVDIAPQQDNFAAFISRDRSAPLKLLRHLAVIEPGTGIAYDLVSWDVITSAYYQLWAQDKRFMMFNSNSAPPPAARVIASRNWPARAAYRQVACESSFDACLYTAEPESRSQGRGGQQE